MLKSNFILWGVLLCFLPLTARAVPYPFPEELPPEEDVRFLRSEVMPASAAIALPLLPSSHLTGGSPVLRVQLDWNPVTESYTLSEMVKEWSGTPALERRTRLEDELGSFQVLLRDYNGEVFRAQSIGTGTNYRKLTRSITARFPWIDGKFHLELIAEHPRTGEMRLFFQQEVDTSHARLLAPKGGIEIRKLRDALQEPSLVLNVVAEGYLDGDQKRFFREARKVVDTLERKQFPGQEFFEIRAVFAPSDVRLGMPPTTPANDPAVVPPPSQPPPPGPVTNTSGVDLWNSFLSLYYPYWNRVGRWYHVVYPTSEKVFRDSLGQFPYDYAIALVDSDGYWGVGNFKAFTAVPSRSLYFPYLLLHEFGHFFGLNEEYEGMGTGPTELEFAPEIQEPWSQNITFLKDPHHLKWSRYVRDSTPIPTPSTHWERNQELGAYPGGYAESEPLGHSHKPGFRCVMDRDPTHFCEVCRNAILERIEWDLGGI